ncbi:SH3 domain-containing protein [Exiguobacterium sp. AT1b]|uniref:SH3 type 3 domain protein n=1 Tax=Exiguobacterium sp. (strain ATCC BAA-1283 / AT1b) TaxID=360911 RepID=C4L6H3_EXISA|nr:SH3 domain-containing protein [Exiguobacterium sp. AT1b]ACQ70004.1 SH3 type 3 domain protein [Exiguobacterium sp. AT1b]
MKILKGITAGLLSIALLGAPATPFIGEAPQVEASTQVKGMHANVETEAYTTRSSKSKRVMTIPFGASLERTAVNSSWSQVRYKGKTGWVASRDLMEVKKTDVMDTKKTVTLYASRSTKAKIVTKVPAAKQVTRLAVNKSWSQVTYGSKTGWVASSQLKARYTKETFVPRIYQVKEDAPLQSTYATNGETLVSIPKEFIVSSGERYNSWYKVTFSGKTGWVHSKYLTSYKIKDAVYTAHKLFGTKYDYSGSGKEVIISGDKIDAYTRGESASIISYPLEKADYSFYVKTAKLITSLHGGDTDTLANYMWNARPGQKYADGMYYGKYYVIMHPRGGISVIW